MIEWIDGCVGIELNEQQIAELLAHEKTFILRFGSYNDAKRFIKNKPLGIALKERVKQISKLLAYEEVVGEIQVGEQTLCRIGHAVKPSVILKAFGFGLIEIHWISVSKVILR